MATPERALERLLSELGDALAAAGPLRLGALGQRLGVQASTLTRNVDRLVQAGLVRRESDPDDARARFGGRPGERILLVFGGSQAVRRINAAREFVVS